MEKIIFCLWFCSFLIEFLHASFLFRLKDYVKETVQIVACDKLVSDLELIRVLHFIDYDSMVSKVTCKIRNF